LLHTIEQPRRLHVYSRYRDASGFVRLFLILTKKEFRMEIYEKWMKNILLSTKNQEYFMT